VGAGRARAVLPRRLGRPARAGAGPAPDHAGARSRLPEPLFTIGEIAGSAPHGIAVAAVLAATLRPFRPPVA
jgi:hypothetical protein